MTRTVVEVGTRPPYPVVVGPGALDELGERLAGFERAALLTDRNVAEAAPTWAAGARRSGVAGVFERLPTLALEPGESSKSFAALERALEFLAGSDLDRGSAVVALGGGVVGDLAGLAASLYMRGVALLLCPTTLLAQVDASIGGKTAVNLRAGKNLAGTFHRPSAVLADTHALATLPEDELRSGLGEAVKTALVGDPGLLALLEEQGGAILGRDPDALARLVERCARVKAAVVAADERERGERAKLNLGHTFAHAIERSAGYGTVPHGIAVAAGLGLALEASRLAGLLEDEELPGRVRGLLGSLGLPGDLEVLRRRYGVALGARELEAGLRHDKKGRAGEPRWVLVRAAGDLALGRSLERRILDQLFA